MATVALMQPASLSAYSALIEKYLQNDLAIAQQTYCDFPQQTRNILRNYDIQMYSLRLNTRAPEEHHEEDINDESLLRRIQQYNRIAKPNKSRDKDKTRRNRRTSDGENGKPKRKVRTTITPAKLQQMNRIFKEYLENQQKSKIYQDEDGACSNQSDRLAEYGSLKLIGQRLGLGYSTILHKFREYRATRKVKGGALIASINQKRKYKKSREIQELIQRSLNESTFYTAVELSKYIQEKYKKVLSRSIISRHLGEMGYSYKNVRTTKPTNHNNNQIKEIRRNFAVALAIQRELCFAKIFYLDQHIFMFDEINKKLHIPSQQDDESLVQVNLTVLANPQLGILKYSLADHPMCQTQFAGFFSEAEKQMAREKQPRILVMDIDNPNHVNQCMTDARHRLCKQKIKIYYQPPFSQQFNILDRLFITIKQRLAAFTFETVEEFKEGIVRQLNKYVDNLQDFQRDTNLYIMRGMIMQNF